MLTVKISRADKQFFTLEDVLTVRLDADLNVPADSLTVTCPYNDTIRKNAQTIQAYNGDRLVFRGRIDSVDSIKRAQGVIMKITARSLAAALLDNEAEPVTYFDPTAVMIESRHLRPFGITLANRDNQPYYDSLKIDKGMSHWSVIERFCRARYHSEPRISGDGTAYLDRRPSDEVAVFSDSGSGIPYISLNESRRPYRLISEIRLKFRQANTYGSVIRNANPEARQVTRVRYVNAAADKTTLATADKMLENSNRRSYLLKLSCAGCHCGLLGKRAEVRDSVLGTIGGLAVRKVSYTVSSRGEFSTIELEKENYNVVDELHN